ncbi:uncharacterized protein A1O5_13239, partial [Cladophialophora psammophila CBS 110553]
TDRCGIQGSHNNWVEHASLECPNHRLQYLRLSAWLIELFFLLINACIKISIELLYHKISSCSHSI